MPEKIIQQKICSNCKEQKPISCFSKNGRRRWCRGCDASAMLAYRRTKNGCVAGIYNNQTGHSKRRGHKPPTYSLNEFRKWMLSIPEFHTLFDNWVDSNFDKWLAPSFDRENDYIGYSFDNFRRVCTWRENYDRCREDMKSGVNNKINKQVKQLAKNGELINSHHSLQSAGRRTGIDFRNISSCCHGKLKTAGGFRWSFA